MKRPANDCSPVAVAQKRACPFNTGLKDILLSKSLMPPAEFTTLANQFSAANSLQDDWIHEELDFLCDKTVKFIGSGNTKNIIGIEISESSRYFDKHLHYNQQQPDKPLVIPDFCEACFSEVIDFTRGKTISLTEQNCVDVYQCADFLLVEKLCTLCLTFIQKCCKNSVSFAMRLWPSSREFFSPELTRISFEEIIKNFSQALTSKEWLEFQLDEVLEVLQSHSLNAQTEMVVFTAIRKWVETDQSRIPHLDVLLCCIRIGRMTSKELRTLSDQELVRSREAYSSVLLDYPNIKDGSVSFFSQHIEALSVVATPRQPHEIVFVFGGWCQVEGPKAACQVYDPRADQWTLWQPNRDLPTNHICQIEKRVYAGCVIIKNVVYLVGGYDGHTALKSVMSYNLEEQSGWYESSCMLERRYYVCSVELDGFLYAIGGHTGENQNQHAQAGAVTGRLKSVERLNIQENTWYAVQEMHSIRSDAGATTLKGKVYVAGGFDGHNYHDSVEMYDPQIDQWTIITRMNNRRGGVCLVTFGNCMYAVGGNDGNNRLDVIEKYSEQTGEWLYAGRLTCKKSNLSTALVRDSIMVIGGWSDEGEPGILSAVESFSPTLQQSTLVQPMNFSASATASCTLSDRAIAASYINRDFSIILPWQKLRSPLVSTTVANPSSSEHHLQDEPSLREPTTNESQPL